MLTIRRNLFTIPKWILDRMLPRSPIDVSKIDPCQRSSLEERCILVNQMDAVEGSASKMDCHLWKKGTCPLHRAFSVFLFNQKKEMLVQQRAMTKVTFPGYYTNTCCSHPLDVYDELEEKNAMGVRRAAVRRCKYELGIDLEPEDLTLLTRILYKSQSNDIWGEHEVDYVLIAQKDAKLLVNPNEVQDYKWIPREGFQEFLDKCSARGIPLTPWFRIIASKFLLNWWDNLDNLEKLQDLDNIHKIVNDVPGGEQLLSDEDVKVKVIKGV